MAVVHEQTHNLDNKFVRYGFDEFHVGSVDDVCFAGLRGQTLLGYILGSVFDALGTRGLIRDNSRVEIFLTARFLHMFDTDVETFHDNAVSDRFRNLYANACAGDIEHTPCTSLVEFVRHSFHYR